MIYFIQAGKNGPIKIGYTDNDIQNRLNQLQIGCPYELKLLWSIKGSQEDELKIHSSFEHERIRGEWFRPSRKLLTFINEDAVNNYFNEIDELVEIEESKKEIGISREGWNFSEIKDRRELHLYFDDYYKLILDLSQNHEKYSIKISKYGIFIKTKEPSLFGGINLFLNGEKEVKIYK